MLLLLISLLQVHDWSAVAWDVVTIATLW